MSYADAVLLAVIQGVTEFLPISSSGHLIVVRELGAISVPEALAFDVLLHVATLAAIGSYFWRDIARLARVPFAMAAGRSVAPADRRMCVGVLVGTVPAVVFGMAFQSFVKETLRTPMVVVFALLIGSVVFSAADMLVRAVPRRLSVPRSLAIGVFQSLALIPGTSRSGITIAGGLLAGLSREQAVRFAFLLGVPVIAGAGAMTFITADAVLIAGPHIFGAITAFVVGLASIHFLVRFLRSRSLFAFSIYRVILAVVVFALLV